MNKEVRGIDPRAMELLTSYAYPGNVRELANIVERAVALCGQEMITERDLPPDLAAVELASFARPDSESPTLEELERRYIEHILEITGGVRTRRRTSWASTGSACGARLRSTVWNRALH